MSLLEVNNLCVTYKTKKDSKLLVNNISFTVEKNECVVLLGESGSGKSMSVGAITGLLDKNFVVEGQAFFEGKDLIACSKKELKEIRGSQIGMVLQSPMTCFDPLYRLGKQIDETLKTHTNLNKTQRYNMAIEMLERYHLEDAPHVMEKYPHQLSGGMLQRIMIGLSVVLNPKLIVADEPTTAIDLITAKEVVRIFNEIKKINHCGIIFVTHDLGIAKEIGDKVIVLNNSKLVDSGTYDEIIHRATDPYTKLLIEKRSSILAKYKKAIGGI